MSIGQYLFVLRELTKRELKRKYAGSFLGLLWSCVYPLLRMLLVLILFSTVFHKGIDRYPAYYFAGFLPFEFFATATATSVTALRDNRELLLKTKLPREMFVLSRVLTAFVNFLLGCIPFALVLAACGAEVTRYLAGVPFVLALLAAFTVGFSRALSVWYVFRRDAKNIHENFVFILRFFVAMFYSVDWVSDGVREVIGHNPLYAFIRVLREWLVYGRAAERAYLVRIVLWTAGVYLAGTLVFKSLENEVMERL